MQARKQRRFLLAASGLALGLASLPALAEIYQWRDAEGRLHFSDRQPKGAKAEDVSHKVEDVNVDESSGERKKLGGVFRQETAAEKQLQQQQLQQQQQERRQQQQQCANARQQLRVLQGPVYFTRTDGSTYTVSERERARRAAELEARIREYCDL